jgi:DNA excision repair protein ERCC-2
LSIPDAKIVTATYHYLFEEASKSLLFTNTQLDPRHTILVIDEAHNLRDFIRSITTSEISFDELERSVEDSRALFFGKVSASLCLLAQRTRGFCDKYDGWHLDKPSFMRHLRDNEDEAWLPNLALELTACANAAWYSISSGANLPLSVLRVGKFLTGLLASVKDEGSILTKSTSGLTIVNADPGKVFLASTKNFRSVILLSATINPFEIFLKSLGLENTPVELHTAKSIESLQIMTVLDLGVTTKFKSRTADMYEKIAGKIAAVIQSSRGGIGIFAPSYSVLGSLKTLIERKTPDSRKILVETRGITNEKAAEVMSEFKSTSGSILLAVQGGRFSEGEDFRDEQMDISIVVGLALPPPSPLMYAEYSFLGKTDPDSSYLMISLLPALRKAFQSAGRHIRSPNKRGMVFLLDSRFNSKTIVELMPKWLRRDLITGDFAPATISEMIRGFEEGTKNNN